MSELTTEPTLADAQVELEIKRIEAADRQRQRESDVVTAGLKAQARITGLSVLAVAGIVLVLSVGSIILTQDNKVIPAFVATTIAVAVTGLVGLLSFNAGKSSAEKKA
jgi:hypothetical protein